MKPATGVMDWLYEDSYGPECSKDPELWFSEIKQDKQRAIKLCGDCPQKAECLEMGAAELWGIWGGVDMNAGSAKRERVFRAEAKAERDMEILDLSSEGLSFSEVGRRMGISHVTVATVVRRQTAA